MMNFTLIPIFYRWSSLFSSSIYIIILFFLIEFSTSKGEDILIKDRMKLSQLSGKHIIVSGYDVIIELIKVLLSKLQHILILLIL